MHHSAISREPVWDDMPFQDRAEAGRNLAKSLLKYKELRPIVLALPRGGVPVAAEVAAALDAPLDLVLVRKIGLPGQEELAMGAVVDGGAPITVRNEDVILMAGIGEAEFSAVRDRELAEIERRRKHYIGTRARAEIKDHVAIVIDDGIATGATIRAALKALRLRDAENIDSGSARRPVRYDCGAAGRRPMKSSASKNMKSSVPLAFITRIFGRSRIARSLQFWRDFQYRRRMEQGRRSLRRQCEAWCSS